MFFTPYRLYHKPPLRGGFFWLVFRPAKSRRPAVSMVAKRVMKEEDGVPCAIYKRPKQMMVKVGSGSSGDTFELKGAEWADVEAGSHDAAVRAQARESPKYAAIAAARASTPSAPDFELTDAAGPRSNPAWLAPACLTHPALASHHCRAAGHGAAGHGTAGHRAAGHGAAGHGAASC